MTPLAWVLLALGALVLIPLVGWVLWATWGPMPRWGRISVGDYPTWRDWAAANMKPWPPPPPPPPTITWDEYRADPEGTLRMAERQPVTVVGDERFSTMVLTACVVDDGEAKQ